MDIRRIILYAALALVIYSLWTSWQADYPAAPKQPMVQSSHYNQRMLPSLPSDSNPATTPAEAIRAGEGHQALADLIHVRTDVFDLAIDLKQGDIVSAKLLDYPQSVKDKRTPFTLLQNNPGARYVANSDLYAMNQGQTVNVKPNFTSSERNYQLSPSQKELVVTLTSRDSSGLKIQKEFVFTPGSYVIGVRYVLANSTDAAWHGYMNMQFLRSSPQEDKSSMFHVGSFTGASYSQPGQHRYKKLTFKEMNKANLQVDVTGGWVAMQQHYFLSAWIPNQQSKSRLYTRSNDRDYSIGAVSQAIALAPGQSQTVGARLYLGPEVTDLLKAVAPGLDLTVDYGWLWFLSSLLFSLMKMINNVVANWGWSIVLVTVLIKLAFYRLSATSYKSMANMRKLQPKLQSLRERYGDDKAKISQATMELYRSEKVNPLGGCLPILIQIPVFIALYWVLLESVELRQAPFILWISDLASADPYHVLPVIMGLTMLIQQKLNPAPPDPMQAKVMMFLPVLFTGLFWNFPAGLVLYWIVNNSLSILQQWYITRKYGENTDNKTPKKLVAVK